MMEIRTKIYDTDEKYGVVTVNLDNRLFLFPSNFLYEARRLRNLVVTERLPLTLEDRLNPILGSPSPCLQMAVMSSLSAISSYHSRPTFLRRCNSRISLAIVNLNLEDEDLKGAEILFRSRPALKDVRLTLSTQLSSTQQLGIWHDAVVTPPAAEPVRLRLLKSLRLETSTLAYCLHSIEAPYLEDLCFIAEQPFGQNPPEYWEAMSSSLSSFLLRSHCSLKRVVMDISQRSGHTP